MNMHERPRFFKSNAGQIVSEGRLLIGPSLAKRILHECWFDGQEGRMNDTADMFIIRHVEHMRRGTFHTSVIFFAVMPDGKMYLLDGYHRLNAVIDFGRDMKFVAIVEPCQTYDEVRSLYSTFNRPGSERIRTLPQILNALGIAEKLGVQKKMLESAYGVMPVIGNEMAPITRADKQAMAMAGVMEARCDLLETFSAEVIEYDRCISGAAATTKVLLRKSPVVAVALQTLKYQREMAIRFWTAVANDDGLRKGTPERTLLDYMRNNRHTGRNDDSIVGVALAWNAYFTGRPISALKINATKTLHIEGTPIERER